jgi:hypothetical protein
MPQGKTAVRMTLTALSLTTSGAAAQMCAQIPKQLLHTYIGSMHALRRVSTNSVTLPPRGSDGRYRRPREDRRSL